MNFCVYLDNGAEIHGYFVPDGFSSVPQIEVRINGSDNFVKVATWIFIEGARALGAHQTGNVGFVLSDANVPGIASAKRVELSDPVTGLVFYRRAEEGQYLPRKVLRVETAYVPHSEIDLSLKPHFQFFEHRVERYGFETIRQMLEIINQPSVYVAGRILLKNFRSYIDYNIDTTIISLRDPFYELAMRLIIFSRIRRQSFSFVPDRDVTLFEPVINYFDGLDFYDEVAVRQSLRRAPRDVVALLSSPFTHQLVASSPSDAAKLDDVSQALDALSQFTLFDAGSDGIGFPETVAELLGLPPGSVKMKSQMEPVHQLADILRSIGRAEHMLEADLLLYHFIQESERRVSGG